MKDLLDSLLPRLGAADDTIIVSFEGKGDLEKRAAERMRKWREASGTELRFVLVRDNDGSDCTTLKGRLLGLLPEPRGQHLVRIVMQELESWFLGDLAAVAAAYGKPALARLSGQEMYREPDRVRNASEELERLTKDRSKRIRASRIAPHMDLERNTSTSFRVFCEGIRKLSGTV